VGAHNASVDHPATFTWTEFDTASGNISRNQALTVNWTGGSAGGTVTISGFSQATGEIGAQFICLADAASGSFTVPVAILSALPPTGSEFGIPLGTLGVTHFRATLIDIPGLDQATVGIGDFYSLSPASYQ
jgi:hypothetical protein